MDVFCGAGTTPETRGTVSQNSLLQRISLGSRGSRASGRSKGSSRLDEHTLLGGSINDPSLSSEEIEHDSLTIRL